MLTIRKQLPNELHEIKRKTFEQLTEKKVFNFQKIDESEQTVVDSGFTLWYGLERPNLFLVDLK